MRIILGIIKGLVAGGLVGLGASQIGLSESLGFLVFGVAAALSGLVCGKPPWRHETVVTPILKMVFGFGVGAGLSFAWSHFDLGTKVGALGLPAEIAVATGPMLIAILYGLFVEIDDGGGKAAKPA